MSNLKALLTDVKSQLEKHRREIIIGLIIAVIWGYFSDLRHGQIGWFIGRLIFIPWFVVAFNNFKEK